MDIIILIFISACTDPHPLGMGDGRIRDSQLTASSVWGNDSVGHGPANARLNYPAGQGAGAWVAGSNDVHQWIQVDLLMSKMVYGIVLQGREEHQQWVTKYKVQYIDGGLVWLDAEPKDPQNEEDDKVSDFEWS